MQQATQDRDGPEPSRFSARRLLSAHGISILAEAADSRQALRAMDDDIHA
ncbi:hypothetical protein GCM10022255_111700 [Dactylosporangium darangshiense]|uniref:Uncharacterized protein n=1 Tax=Dactylosporangium darangshiense TaxID=579108 RepID=A0ABP8DV25_9ACTN